MPWSLAQNLVNRTLDVRAVYPKLTIYNVGDLAHQAECSDHNPDARGIVHAIDIMAAAGSAEAKAILPWLLSWHADLQYVIHNGRIWGVDNGGFSGDGQRYVGSDQHTDHIHVSGKHGTTGRNAATCTGYDTKAEQMVPPPLEVDMPLNQTDANLVVDTLLSRLLGKSGPNVGVALQGTYQKVTAATDPTAIANAVIAAIQSAGSTVSIDESQLTDAIVAALKQLAAEDAPN